MTKPKFTPDPPPAGLDQQLAEYLHRQFNRIEDWWPKDFEARIQALELLAPYCSGTWITADSAYVSFAGYLVGEYGTCSPDTATIDNRFAFNIPETSYETDIQSIALSADGTVLYGAAAGSGGLGSGIYQFPMSTAYDISTIQAANIGFLAITPGGGAGSASAPWGVNLSSDGTKLYFYDRDTTPSNGDARVVQYNLSTSWDITTGTYSTEISVQTNNPLSIDFVMSRDGKHFYLSENSPSSSYVYQYDLSEAWSIGTASYIQREALNTTYAGRPVRMNIDASGTHLIVDSATNTKLEIFELVSAHDISTAAWQKTISITDTLNAYGAFTSNDCSTLIVNDGFGNEFDQYALG